MRSKAEVFEVYAGECDRRAATAAGMGMRALFRNLAVQWRALASTVSQLEAERKASEAQEGADWRQALGTTPDSKLPGGSTSSYPSMGDDS